MSSNALADGVVDKCLPLSEIAPEVKYIKKYFF